MILRSDIEALLHAVRGWCAEQACNARISDRGWTYAQLACNALWDASLTYGTKRINFLRMARDYFRMAVREAQS